MSNLNISNIAFSNEPLIFHFFFTIFVFITLPKLFFVKLFNKLIPLETHIYFVQIYTKFLFFFFLQKWYTCNFQGPRANEGQYSVNLRIPNELICSVTYSLPLEVCRCSNCSERIVQCDAIRSEQFENGHF